MRRILYMKKVNDKLYVDFYNKANENFHLSKCESTLFFSKSVTVEHIFKWQEDRMGGGCREYRNREGAYF